MIAYKKMTLLKGKFLNVQGEYYFILTSARDISQNANMCDKKGGQFRKKLWC